jgi:hypothetical protein
MHVDDSDDDGQRQTITAERAEIAETLMIARSAARGIIGIIKTLRITKDEGQQE